MFPLIRRGLIAWGWVLAASAWAQPSARILHGPYLCAPTETAVTVVFVTDQPGVPQIDLRLAHAPQAPWKMVQASAFGLKAANQTVHRIRLTGLAPGAAYQYRAVFKAIQNFEPYKITWGDSLCAGPFIFKAGDAAADSVRFAVFNDVHERAAVFDSLLVAGPLGSLDRVFLNGDMLNHIESPNQLFAGWLDTAVARFAQTLPLVYVPGNHETRGAQARALPDYLPPADGRYHGLFRQGPVAFVVLDSGEDKPDSHWAYSGLTDFDAYREAQAAWLKTAVQDPAYRDATFRVAIVHIPPLEGSDWHGIQEVRRLFAPILADSGLDLMISAHMHQAMLLTGDDSPGFPLLVNGKNTGIWVEADARRLTVRRIGTDGTVQETRVFPSPNPLTLQEQP